MFGIRPQGILISRHSTTLHGKNILGNLVYLRNTLACWQICLRKCATPGSLGFSGGYILGQNGPQIVLKVLSSEIAPPEIRLI
jgi:hypothetical protein